MPAGGTLLAVFVLAIATVLAQPAVAGDDTQTVFRRIPTQYIAALADPAASAGNNAGSWGRWRVDPGPRGVGLDGHERLMAAGGVAPAKWQFDSTDWWLEENGLIMESPEFPLTSGRYLVTGGRATTTVLTVHPEDGDGTRRWELGDGATLHDVTHLRCRAARYTASKAGGSCSPGSAQKRAFPVTPGALMPPVEGCNKQDYSVLFVIGVAVDG